MRFFFCSERDCSKDIFLQESYNSVTPWPVNCPILLLEDAFMRGENEGSAIRVGSVEHQKEKQQ